MTTIDVHDSKSVFIPQSIPNKFLSIEIKEKPENDFKIGFSKGYEHIYQEK